MFEQLLARLKEVYSKFYLDNPLMLPSVEAEFLKGFQPVLEDVLKAYVRHMSIREAHKVETVKEDKNGNISQLFYLNPLNYSKLISEFIKIYEKCQEWKSGKINVAQIFERIYLAEIDQYIAKIEELPKDLEFKYDKDLLDFKRVKLLLDNKADPNQKLDGLNLLSTAVLKLIQGKIQNRKAIVQLLVEYKAEPNIGCFSDHFPDKYDYPYCRNINYSPFMVACSYEDSEIIKALVESKANVNHVLPLNDNDIRTPSHAAVSEARDIVFNTLLELKADLHLQRPHLASPLEHAIINGRAKFIEKLVTSENINQQSDFRPSPLRMAISYGEKEYLPVIKKLLEMKAMINLPDSRGVTPLLAVPMEESFSFSNPEELCNGYTTSGEISFRDPDHCLKSLSSPETAILLLESKADITWSNKNRQTVVDIAIQYRQIYILAAISFHCLRLLNANFMEIILSPYLIKNLSFIVHEYLYLGEATNSLVDTYDKRQVFLYGEDLELKEDPSLLQAAKKGEGFQLEKLINRDHLYIENPLHEEVTQAVHIATIKGKKNFGFVASMAKLLHTWVSEESTASSSNILR